MIAASRPNFWTRKTMKILTDKAKDTVYHIGGIPAYRFNGDYGLYLHIPFCRSHCRFCPYYKELFRDDDKAPFLAALEKEIEIRDFTGTPQWMYIGGGTPNLLSVEDYRRIFDKLREKVTLDNIGMEVHPAYADPEYLAGLAGIGVRKISVGVESFSKAQLEPENRSPASLKKLQELAEAAENNGLWLNFDMMVGFPEQKIHTFRQDILTALKLRPHQFTLYPVMTIRGQPINKKTLDELAEYAMIEEAGQVLQKAGYRRKTLWTWGRDGGLYDSSYDELGSDYLGLGPSGISSTRQWVTVNLPLKGYVRTFLEDGEQLAFVNRHVKTSAHEHWRRFGEMLYSRKLGPRWSYPPYMNIFISLLLLSGNSFFGRLTKKGLYYAHRLTKAVVETKCFPLQYPGCVDNRGEYGDYL